MTLPGWFWSMPWAVIRAVATELNVDPLVIASIIVVESNVNSCAVRYEDHWSYLLHPRIWAERVGSTVSTETTGQKTSWGYMQVMGTVAREHGFDDFFPRLCEPKTGIWYGAEHYKKHFKEFGKREDALAAYNGGASAVLNRTPGGNYPNEAYVDKVMRYYRRIEKMQEKI